MTSRARRTDGVDAGLGETAVKHLRGTCGPTCLGLKDVAPVVWWLALSWVLAVAAGTVFGAWRDAVARRVTKSRATAAQPGA